MKEIWQNKKARIGLIFGAVVILLCIVLIILKLTDRGTKVEVAKVERNNVEQHYDTTGNMSSVAAEKYYAYVGMVPKEVKVKPGDVVCKGDILATFDTSVLNSVISERRDAYDEATKTYNNALQGKNDTKAQEAELDTQIKALEAKIKELEAQGQNSQNANQNTPDFSSMTPEQLQQYIQNASQNFDSNEITDSQSALEVQLLLLKAQKALLGTGNSDSLIAIYKQNVDSTKAAYDAAVKERADYENGLVAKQDGKVTDVFIKEGVPYTKVEDKSASGDLSALLSGMTGNESGIDLTSLLSGLTASESSVDKGLAITIDYYEGYNIAFTLGKYDLETVKVGMPATITYLDYKYEGEVSYISATAQSTTDIVSSMMGSSTTTTSSVDAQVTILNPDEKLVLGFDAKVSILVAKKDNVLTIPVEALVIKDEKMYVYVIENGKATLKEIEVGASSETYYEVTKGLTEGEEVILNSSKIHEGDKVYS